MPKEMIYGEVPKKSWLQVGWEKDSNRAQLGMSIASNFVFTNGRGERIEDDTVYTYQGAPGVAQALYFTFSSRAEINRLIRELRKARDGAYGKDE